MPNNSDSLAALNLQASLTVANLETSLAWYRDVLRFTLARKHERDGTMFAASLGAGDVRILLVQDNGARGTDRVKGEGFSLQLTVSEDVDGIARNVEAHGVAFDTPPGDGFGARFFRVRDPDGFRWTISSQRPDA